MTIHSSRFGWVGPCVALLGLQVNLIGSAFAAAPVEEAITTPAEPKNAAEFDQRLKSPGLVSQAEMKTQLRESFDKAAGKPIAERMRVGDMRWVDLQWHLNRIVQAGQPLPDLSEYGLEKRADGSYVLDVAKNPQWGLWYRALSDLGEPGLFGIHAQRLLERGFRDQDIEIMQDYVRGGHPQRAVFDSEKLMIKGVKAHRSKAPRLQRIAAADAATYAYQFDRAREKAKQRWAAGLLDRLDKQRQRILISYFQEISGTIAFLPDTNFAQSIDQFAEAMTSGKVEQHLLEQEQELAQ